MSNVHALTKDESQLKISFQMRAVLAIFAADPELMNFIGKAVDFENDSVYWDQVFTSSLSSGQRAACLWAYSLWVDDIKDQVNVFDAALSMDTNLRTAVLRAIRIRWGLQT